MPVYGGLVPLGFTHSENPDIHRPDQELLYQIGKKKQGRRGLRRNKIIDNANFPICCFKITLACIFP